MQEFVKKGVLLKRRVCIEKIIWSQEDSVAAGPPNSSCVNAVTNGITQCCLVPVKNDLILGQRSKRTRVGSPRRATPDVVKLGAIDIATFRRKIGTSELGR